MDKDDFKAYLAASSLWALQFAKTFIKDSLAPEVLYNVELNQSMDKDCGEEFVCYPKDEGKVYFQKSADEVVALLARDGRVPAWIDISVKSATKKTTTLELLCSGRFTDNKERMYYAFRGCGPFGVKSPNTPLGWTKGKRFWLKHNLPKRRKWLKLKMKIKSAYTEFKRRFVLRCQE